MHDEDVTSEWLSGLLGGEIGSISHERIGDGLVGMNLRVALDRDLFKQALLNLLLNAQQAMPRGGELTIQAAATPNGVVLSLIDTGEGMAPEVVAKAFKPFFSTKLGGSGLGLPTTRKIVLAHGGTLDLQSEVGKGTKFTISLPAIQYPA